MAETATPAQDAAQIVPFNFNDRAVRVTTINGEPWFVCTDVAETLGYRNAPDAARHLDADEKGTQIVRTPGGDQRLTVINESGLYSLVLRSRKPEAKRFAKWVTREVLPTIRKTGRYEGAPYSVHPDQKLSGAQADELRGMLREAAGYLPKEKQRDFMRIGWSKLNSHFKVQSYRDIPSGEFSEAVSLVTRHQQEHGAEPPIEPPTAIPRLTHDGLVTMPASARWIASTDHTGRMILEPLSDSAVIGTPEQIAAAIEGGGWPLRSVMPLMKSCANWVSNTAAIAAKAGRVPVEDVRSAIKEHADRLSPADLSEIVEDATRRLLVKSVRVAL